MSSVRTGRSNLQHANGAPQKPKPNGIGNWWEVSYLPYGATERVRVNVYACDGICPLEYVTGKGDTETMSVIFHSCG